VDVADRRTGASTVRVRVGSVRGRAASRDRCGRRARRIGACACGRHRVVRRIRPRGRSRADDPHRGRLLRDPAAARIGRRGARGRGRRGSARRRGRRERRRGHARAARAPRRSAHRRRGGLPRPARVPAGAFEGRCPGARARRGAASGAAAARTARAARRAACAAACSRCSAARAADRPRRTDVERGACRRRAGNGRRPRRARSRRGVRETARRVGRSDSACSSRAATPALGQRDGSIPRELTGEPGARGTSRLRCEAVATCGGRPEVVQTGSGCSHGRAHASGPEARRERGVRRSRVTTACLARGARTACADRRCAGPDRGAAEAASYHGHG